MSELFQGSFIGAKPPGLNGEVRRRFELRSEFEPDGEAWLKTSYAATVLREVRAGYEEMRAQNPELYVGMTVYGSSVKGRFHEESDVDIVIFTDSDELKVNDSLYFESGQQKHEDVLSYIAGGLQGVDLNHMVNDVVWHPMNERIATQSAENAVAELKEIQKVVSDNSADSGGRTLDVSTLINADMMKLFFMQVGGGKIKQFRKCVLDTLWEFGECGDLVWDNIASWVASYKESRRGASIYFPKTIERAYSYFGIKKPEFTMFELGGSGVMELRTLRLLGTSVNQKQQITRADV